MRFLVDECTGPGLALWLRAQGHDVFSVYEQARGLGDDEIIERAMIEDRILITNDKDFGEKVYREKRQHKGIILLRLNNERYTNKERAIKRLLQSYFEHLPGNFVVVTETSIRISGK